MSGAVLMAWLLRHEVLVGWVAAIAGAMALTGGLYAVGHHAGVVAERPKVEEARRQAAVATAQTAVTSAAAAAADTAAQRTVHVTVKAEEAVHEVQAAQGATDALDPDLLARWRSGLVGLRTPAPGADRPGGGEPADAVPVAGR